MTPAKGAAGESLLSPHNAIPFAVVAVIWGSTWLVIKDQVSAVPPSWSIAYRFAIATAAMFALAAWRGDRVALPRAGQRWAVALGVTQFTANLTFVYNAERFITSGLVAVLFALLVVPNAVAGKLLLGQAITRRFVAGSGIAAVGVAALFWHEYRASPASLSDVLWGAGLASGGILAASSANIIQALEPVRRYPLVTLLAWGMLWGTAMNIACSLILYGAPVVETRGVYWGGVVYLAIAGSVMTFPLYYGLIRRVGAGRAAYNSVAVPVVAMLLSTLFEGYRWTPLAIGGAMVAMAGLAVALRARVRS